MPALLPMAVFSALLTPASAPTAAPPPTTGPAGLVPLVLASMRSTTGAVAAAVAVQLPSKE